MEKFSFKAKNWDGKIIKGLVEANTAKEALLLLRQREIIVFSLKPHRKNFLTQFFSLVLYRVNLEQLVGFTRQLATMINAGLPITDSLKLIREQSKGKMGEIIEEILAKVQGGEPLGKALIKDRKIFGDVFIASIEAGEQGGVLEKVLLRLADNLEKKKEFAGKVKGAMIYPVIIIIGMIIVTFVMMTFVVPKMTSLYGEFGTKMPEATRILMSIADFFSKNVYLFPLVAVGAFLLYRAINKTSQGRFKIDELKLKIPIVGPLLTTISVTEVTRTLGTLLGTGVPLVSALKIVSDASGNEVLRRGLSRAAENVEKGLPLSEALSESPSFPPIIPQMIGTGEQTGKLDEILMNVSHYFETESEQKVKALTSAIEPLIMVVLGLGVGFLVVAIIMPIYSLTSQF